MTGAVVKGSRATYAEIGSDELLVICPSDSPLATRKHVALADLAEADWVMRERGSGTRQVAEQLLTERGVDPDELRVVVELGTGEAIVSAVEGGLGVAMLSRQVADKALSLGTVAQVDLEGPAIVRPFYTLLPKGTPTRAAEAFAGYLAESCQGRRDVLGGMLESMGTHLDEKGGPHDGLTRPPHHQRHRQVRTPIPVGLTLAPQATATGTTGSGLETARPPIAERRFTDVSLPHPASPEAGGGHRARPHARLRGGRLLDRFH